MLAQDQAPGFLRRATISPETKWLYNQAWKAFASWDRSKNLPLRPVSLMSTTRVQSFEHRASLRQAAMIGPRLIREDERDPLPEPDLGLLFELLALHGRLDSAICAVLQFDTYARPSENLHALRRSGPAIDRFTKSRSAHEVKKRGRWLSDKSVARYEKHAKLLRQLQRMSLAQQRDGRLAFNQLAITLLDAIRHR